MDMDGKAVLFDVYSVNDVAKAFFSGILLGYTNYKQIHPENNKCVTIAGSDAERCKPIFKYNIQAYKNCFPDRAKPSNNGQVDIILVVVENLNVGENDQLSMLAKILMDPTMYVG